jgi:hypothetical protein
MDVSVQLVFDDEAVELERTIRCELYKAPTGIGYWDRAVHVFGTRVRNGGGVAVVTPQICGYLDAVAHAMKHGELQAGQGGMPKNFLPLVMYTDDMSGFSSFTLFLTRSYLTNSRSRARIIRIDARPSPAGKEESQDDEFSWLRFGPKGPRAFDHSARPVAFYRGWQAVKFTDDMWRGHEPTENALAKYKQSGFLPFSDQPRYREWPDYPPAGYFPPELSVFLGGMPLPPCQGEIAWRFLCVQKNTFESLIPLMRGASNYVLSDENRGMLVLYKVASEPGEERGSTTLRNIDRGFSLELDGVHPNPGSFSRLIFYRPQAATLIEVHRVGFQAY